MSILPTQVTTDPEIVDARLAVLPIGSFEQHGPHLPLADGHPHRRGSGRRDQPPVPGAAASPGDVLLLP